MDERPDEFRSIARQIVQTVVGTTPEDSH